MSHGEGLHFGSIPGTWPTFWIRGIGGPSTTADNERDRENFGEPVIRFAIIYSHCNECEDSVVTEFVCPIVEAALLAAFISKHARMIGAEAKLTAQIDQSAAELEARIGDGR